MSEGKKKGGFASMDSERLKEVASKGGKSSHAQGKAHKFTREEASEAGKIGGSRTKNKQ